MKRKKKARENNEKKGEKKRVSRMKTNSNNFPSRRNSLNKTLD